MTVRLFGSVDLQELKTRAERIYNQSDINRRRTSTNSHSGIGCGSSKPL